MKRARKLWAAFLMAAIMTISMGIPTVYAEDVVGSETTVENTETENGGETPASEENGGETPAPEENGGGTPASDENGGETPAPDENGGETPASEENGGETPAPDENGGETPAPEENGGETPAPDENGGETPAPDENGGETPASDENDGATLASDGEPAIILETGDGTYTFSVGTGAEGSPYEITTEDDLIGLATNVNAGTTYEGVYFKLTADIKLTSDFTPIGKYSSNSFQGTFDGLKEDDETYTISADAGIVIGDSNSNSNYQGLFGYIDGSATIKNVTVSADVVGASYVGGVVGLAGYGDNSDDVANIIIENCHFTGTITATGNNVGGVVGYVSASEDEEITITNCSNTGTVNGAYNVGGVVGYAQAGSGGKVTVSKCYNTGNVTGTNNNVGGVVGANAVVITSSTITVEYCYNTGNVEGKFTVGGVVGANEDTSRIGTIKVEYCYNEGAVTGTGTDVNYYVGGVVGNNYGGTVQYCYNTGAVTNTGESQRYVGGVVGYNYGGTVQYCYNTGAVTDEGKGMYYVGGVVGSNSSGTVTSCFYNKDTYTVSGSTSGVTGLTTSEMTGKDETAESNRANTKMADLDAYFGFKGDEGITRYYPYLTAFGSDSAVGVDALLGAGTESDPYIISNEAELRFLSEKVNAGTTYSGKHFKLTADIELTSDFTPIGKSGNSFQGTFDGNSKTISAAENVVIGDNSKEDQGLFGYITDGASISDVTVSVEVVGTSYVGGVVGYASTSSGTITISNCSNTGDVTGTNDNVGGVVGYASTSSGTITISNCSNTGTVEGKNNVGGVVGYVSATSGTVTVSKCYNTGNVTGEGNRRRQQCRWCGWRKPRRHSAIFLQHRRGDRRRQLCRWCGWRKRRRHNQLLLLQQRYLWRKLWHWQCGDRRC